MQFLFLRSCLVGKKEKGRKNEGKINFLIQNRKKSAFSHNCLVGKKGKIGGIQYFLFGPSRKER